MGDKLNLEAIESSYNAVETLNANFEAIEEAIDNTLSRDGDTPNHMNADLDMNGHRILNAVISYTGEGAATPSMESEYWLEAHDATYNSTSWKPKTTNSDACIVPNGEGSIIAAIPNGAATGGNDRGTNCIDLQFTRTAADQVADGEECFLIGSYNSSTDSNCTRSGAIGGSVSLQNSTNCGSIFGSLTMVPSEAATCSANSCTSIGSYGSVLNIYEDAVKAGEDTSAEYISVIASAPLVTSVYTDTLAYATLDANGPIVIEGGRASFFNITSSAGCVVRVGPWNETEYDSLGYACSSFGVNTSQNGHLMSAGMYCTSLDNTLSCAITGKDITCSSISESEDCLINGAVYGLGPSGYSLSPTDMNYNIIQGSDTCTILDGSDETCTGINHSGIYLSKDSTMFASTGVVDPSNNLILNSDTCSLLDCASDTSTVNSILTSFDSDITLSTTDSITCASIISSTGSTITDTSESVILGSQSCTISSTGTACFIANSISTATSGSSALCSQIGCNNSSIESSLLSLQFGEEHISSGGIATIQTGSGTVVNSSHIGAEYNASGKIVTAGDSQVVRMHQAIKTTDATPDYLASNPSSFSIEGLNLDDNSAFAGKIIVSGFDSTNGLLSTYEFTVSAKKISGTASITRSRVTIEDSIDGGGSVAVDVIASSGNHYIQVTGVAATDINWTAQISGVMMK